MALLIVFDLVVMTKSQAVVCYLQDIMSCSFPPGGRLWYFVEILD
jgi:hypothetical protein